MYSKLFEFIPFYLILAKFGIYYSALFMPKILIFNYNIFILFSRKNPGPSNIDNILMVNIIFQ